MDKLFLVGCGGAVGAILRYVISLVPWKGEFPLLTLITNLAGAILIGLVVGLAFSKDTISPNMVLFFKTGVCGGFTTFSTFSLEALTLLERNQKGIAVVYIFLSVVGCVIGVWFGKKLIMRLKKSSGWNSYIMNIGLFWIM